MINKNFDDFMDRLNLKQLTQPCTQVLSPRRKVFQISDLTELPKRKSQHKSNNPQKTKYPSLPKLSVIEHPTPKLDNIFLPSQSTPKMGHILKIFSENQSIFVGSIDLQNFFQLNDKTIIKQSQLIKKRNVKLQSIQSQEIPQQQLTVLRKANFLQQMIPKSIDLSNQKQFMGSFQNQSDQKMIQPQNRKKISQMSEQQNDQFFTRLQGDPIINSKFIGYNVEVLKGIHLSLLSTAFGGQLHFNVESMRDKHSHMQLTKVHFSTLKRHYIQYLMEYGVPTATIMHFVSKLEHYKPFIINKPTIYDQVGKDFGIAQLASQLQILISQDYILNVYFEKFDTKQRTQILIKFISQLINYVSYACSLHITQVLPSSSPRSIKNFNENYIKNLIINGSFKKCTIGQVQHIRANRTLRRFGGMQDFIVPFVKSCQDDPAIHSMIQKKGLDKFIKNAELFFHYMFNKHPNQINLDDVKVFNRGKIDISPQVFNSLKNKALKLVYQLKPDQILFEDFSESWDEIQEILISPQKQIKLLDPFQLTFMKQITYEIQQMPILIKIYNDSDVDVEKNIMKKMFCLRHPQKYYKKSDLKNIHRLFKIHDYTFDQFLNIFKSEIQKYGSDQSWLVAKIEYYRSSIVSD